MKNFAFTLCKEQEKMDAYKVWYNIYFKEMNRNSEYANHEKELILDELEPSSDIILLKKENQIIGTSRINRPSKSDLSYYSELYRLKDFHEKDVCIVTRYMIYQ